MLKFIGDFLIGWVLYGAATCGVVLGLSAGIAFVAWEPISFPLVAYRIAIVFAAICAGGFAIKEYDNRAH